MLCDKQYNNSFLQQNYDFYTRAYKQEAFDKTLKAHPEQKFKGDLAYKGEDLMETPIKRPRNGKSTKEQKQENKQIPSEGIFVEHRISSKYFELFKRYFG